MQSFTTTASYQAAAYSPQMAFPLAAPLDVSSDVSWVGFANDTLRATVGPHLHHALQRRRLL